MATINYENEEYVLSCVTKGLLSVTREGVVINQKTGNRLGEKPNVKSGYCQFGWRFPGGKKSTILIHRIVFRLYGSGFSYDAPYINHKDGNKANNHIDNLESVSHGQNVQHAVDTGLKPRKTERNGIANKARRGESTVWAKITNEQVVEIFRLYSSGCYSQKSISQLFGVSASAIQAILSKKTFKNVWEEIN